jgi:hypothetical protein
LQVAAEFTAIDPPPVGIPWKVAGVDAAVSDTNTCCPLSPLLHAGSRAIV